MKKMIMVLLGAVLALSLAWAGLAANPPAPDQAPAVCPVMGGKINPNLYVDHNGQRVYFCCPGCLEAFKKDPGKYLKQRQD
ncbi:MAG: YHS domain-containing protein [Deltaproteobacteria bacterium]|nr:YHS domain-containing protein [Deltaproteobacteria bacterium]